MRDGSADDREPRPRAAAILEPRSWRNWQAVRAGTLPSQIVENAALFRRLVRCRGLWVRPLQLPQPGRLDAARVDV
jgi:hypothetical protein